MVVFLRARKLIYLPATLSACMLKCGKFSWVQIFAEILPDPPEEIFVVFIFVGCARRTTPLVRTYVHYVARYAMG